MTNERITAVLSRYEKTLEARDNKPTPEDAEQVNTDPRERRLDHALFVTKQLLAKEDAEDRAEWFGFVQGILWCEGIYTIDDIRKHRTE